MTAERIYIVPPVCRIAQLMAAIKSDYSSPPPFQLTHFSAENIFNMSFLDNFRLADAAIIVVIVDAGVPSHRR